MTDLPPPTPGQWSDAILDEHGNPIPRVSYEDIADQLAADPSGPVAAATAGARRATGRPAGYDPVKVAADAARRRESPAVAAAARTAPPDGPVDDLELTATEADAVDAAAARARLDGTDPVDAVLDTITPNR